MKNNGQGIGLNDVKFGLPNYNDSVMEPNILCRSIHQVGQSAKINKNVVEAMPFTLVVT